MIAAYFTPIQLWKLTLIWGGRGGGNLTPPVGFPLITQEW